MIVFFSFYRPSNFISCQKFEQSVAQLGLFLFVFWATRVQTKSKRLQNFVCIANYKALGLLEGVITMTA